MVQKGGVMGQAFDRDGNVLGEASGDTKREVFERLSAEYPAAHEIRIKSMKERIDAIAEAEKGACVPPRDRMLQFFGYAHLPAHLQVVSQLFGTLAETICATLPSNPERTVALRKLLEAKDCAIRALLFQ